MTFMNKLSSWKNPYALTETDDIFLKAMQENCTFQYENCEDYKRILDNQHFRPEDLKECRNRKLAGLMMGCIRCGNIAELWK